MRKTNTKAAKYVLFRYLHLILTDKNLMAAGARAVVMNDRQLQLDVLHCISDEFHKWKSLHVSTGCPVCQFRTFLYEGGAVSNPLWDVYNPSDIHLIIQEVTDETDEQADQYTKEQSIQLFVMLLFREVETGSRHKLSRRFLKDYNPSQIAT